MPQLQQMQSPAAVVVQKAKVSGALKPLGQHMLQQQPQKILPRQSARGSLARFGIAVAESHHPILAAQDVALGYDTPVQIPPQVTQSSLPIAHRLAVHHPLLGQASRQAQPSRLQRRDELGRKHLGQGLVAEQIPTLEADLDDIFSKFRDK